jgi:hypothetical protein
LSDLTFLHAYAEVIVTKTVSILNEEFQVEARPRNRESCDVVPRLNCSVLIDVVARPTLQHISDAGPSSEERIGEVGFTEAFKF